MAQVRRFREGEQQRGRPHPTSVECVWRVFEGPSGRLLQLDTFGSESRQDKGTQSQTLQLDDRAAAELMSILRRSFPQRP